MAIKGELLIGGKSFPGKGTAFFAIEQTTGNRLGGAFHGATPDKVDEALALSWEAFGTYRETTLEERALFLERIAENILDLGDELVDRASVETGLPKGRIEGERARTVGQLQLFAKEVRNGRFQELRFDPADPERKPTAKPDLKLRNVPLGPVAVFGSSNFPLAFSVAGGDTASALAAGCPVIVKAHSAHPGTSELIGRAVQKAVADSMLAPGVFSLLFDAGFEVGQALVADSRVRAVGFTGSRRGGLALLDIASRRKQPIPVYAEMSSINPVIIFPAALANRGKLIAKEFISSLTLGAGQFCTNPGLVLLVEGKGLDEFLSAAAISIAEAAAQTMLTAGICDAFRRGTAMLESKSSVRVVGRGKPGTTLEGQAMLFAATGSALIEDAQLQDEIFGAASLVVRCANHDELQRVLTALEGQLTVALHIDQDDFEIAKPLIPTLELLAGRLLVNGFGTGVEVSPAMVHGGPYPATSDGRSTSVGTMAIYRFLRPVSYQDFPASLTPPAFSIR
ncbi:MULTISPECIES: aldehyde dehydrogenase (NADP(+)) [unclassified Rhizobium]|uniref:aldehyde dehydrogenase (NADP(+)) n=1 Tax=unclassified Rhizobium TaxID=2613769 RepID=UPI001ADD0AA6|nr:MULTISPECIES: aldehyde dehydrogenase (NADP(+)) [unclassified Rhizobium]MBO9128038.1 aldehyde dehydrogenase (NADP(+)) [Rhizobium sp. 16-488-2b]MBO9178572.1 aldehyde dehydrogenase (NADP(+)) [Rhizobium sp. 16-488-2a]